MPRVIAVGMVFLSLACMGPSEAVLEEDRSWLPARMGVTSGGGEEAGSVLQLRVIAAYPLSAADPVESAVVLGRGRLALWTNTRRVLRVADTERKTVLRYRLPAEVVGVRDLPDGKVEILTGRGEVRTLGSGWTSGSHVRASGSLLCGFGIPDGWIAVQAAPDEDLVAVVSVSNGEVSSIAGGLPAGGRETIDGVSIPRWIAGPGPGGAIVAQATPPHFVWHVGADGSVSRLFEATPRPGGERLTVVQRAGTAVGPYFLRFLLELPTNEGVLLLHDREGLLLREMRIHWPMGLIGYEPEENVLYALADLGEAYVLLAYGVSAVSAARPS